MHYGKRAQYKKNSPKVMRFPLSIAPELVKFFSTLVNTRGIHLPHQGTSTFRFFSSLDNLTRKRDSV